MYHPSPSPMRSAGRRERSLLRSRLTAIVRRPALTMLPLALLLVVTLVLWPRSTHAQDGVHVVRPGDTLSQIAKNYNVDLRQLAADNGLINQNFIFTGQRLVIPDGTAPTAGVTMARAALPAGDGYHTVRRGEMLTQVARSYGMELDDMMRLNGLTDPNLIWVGQKLRVSARVSPIAQKNSEDKPVLAGEIYVVQDGDSLDQIAKDHHTTVYALMEANGLPNTNFVWVGQQMRIKAAPAGFGMLDLANAPADGYRWIEVNLSNQSLTAWQGDVAVLHTNISSGTYRYPTVTGRFSIGTKYTSQRMTGPGYDLPGVPWVMYFFSGYAIHGTYWHNNFGTPMSHGCVNMRTGEAQFLYNWAPQGTEVNVHY